MDFSKLYGRRSFWIIFIFLGILLSAFYAGTYYGIDRVLPLLTLPSGADPAAVDVIRILQGIKANFISLVLPASGAVFILLGYLLWLFLRLATGGLFKAAAEAAVETGPKEKKEVADQKMEQERKRRLFLHFLSILQREGRLIDFFDEDLALYDDEQIGAAVRSIQEDCKRTVEKYLALKPVIDRNEGDPVTVEPGFDPDAVKLVGNVTGAPPFNGVLRHRGWRASKKEVPRLSDVLDSGIIVPAEIEVE